MYSQLFNWLRDTITEELTRRDTEWDEGGRGAGARAGLCARARRQ
jgi:hypothetical protein